jgi:hypothetical protein
MMHLPRPTLVTALLSETVERESGDFADQGAAADLRDGPH